MRVDRSIRNSLIANPYVVLVDLLIATFFILVLYIHSVRLALADPGVARIRQFQKSLSGDVVGYFGDQLQDEGQSTKGKTVSAPGKLDPEELWWKQLPQETNVILKQDASFLKLIMMGATESRALFHPRSAEPTALGRQQFARLARCLGESESAHQLANSKAILSITVEGHTGDESWQTNEGSWRVSMERALRVRQILQEEGRDYDRKYRRAHPNAVPLFSPGRFSVVGRGHYLNLPFSSPQSPANRRVQVEIRFTQRFADQAEASE